MKEVIKIQKINDVYLKIESERHILRQLHEEFTFEAPNAKFHPQVRRRLWDGKIRLFSLVNCLLYVGLLKEVLNFASRYDYKVICDKELLEISEVHEETILNLINQLNCKYSPRDYQLSSVLHALKVKRSIFLSPTGSGKSLMIYLITRLLDKKTLIIVPTLSLVKQMESDFVNYGLANDMIQTIYSGESKEFSKKIIISTWQSIYNLPSRHFHDIDVVIGDECHLFKAVALKKIMEKTVQTKYKFGFTGTLDNVNVHELILKGLFGGIYKVTTTKELIDKKVLANLTIKIIKLQYSKEERKLVKTFDYNQELDYITGSSKRLNFICNLALDLKGNTLILFRFVEKHGKEIYNKLQELLSLHEASSKKLHFITGNIDIETRENIRKIVDSSSENIIVASYGTTSTGVNIVNINNLIFASPSKSKIRTIQSIGRTLRTGEQKTSAVVYDIADDFKYGNKMNFSLKHMNERIRIYTQEDFDYKVYEVNL